ncbi:MAG: hypothetical protein ACRDY6_06645 [Acidimicrobiia bacterium]
MGFSDAFAFRDCPWCGLRDARMHVLIANAATGVPGASARYWALNTVRKLVELADTDASARR